MQANDRNFAGPTKTGRIKRIELGKFYVISKNATMPDPKMTCFELKTDHVMLKV